MIRSGMFMEDRYEILDKIGAGGMSDVYKAKDHKLNRFVAIKFLKQEFCEDKNFVAKFQIEAQSAAALLHPNVVSVYDVNEADGVYYIVMEYVDGITLKRYIDRHGRLPIKEATSIAIQVGQGIEAAHNANIIHRDIKPQNVLISREGKIKVTDFGIARTTTANTISQDILGSVHYISPEQARGGQVDERSDIYSFGIVFYEMITGQLPFDGDSTVTIALKHIQESVPLVSDVLDGIPTGVVRIIEKCTQKKPERRYQKVSSLLADLKTSLISPNEDFVVLVPETQENATVLMTGPDVRMLKSSSQSCRPAVTGASRRHRGYEEYDEYYDDEYDDDYDYGEYDYEDYDDVDYDDDDYDDEYDYEPRRPKKSRNKPKNKKDPSRKKLDKILIICGIVAAAIVLIVLAVVSIRALATGAGCSGSSSRVETVEMIDVRGKNAQEAKTALEEIGLTNIKLKYETSDTVEAEKVIEQSIKEGASVELTKEITLTVSSGKESFELDDYSGKTQSEAQDALKVLGVQVKVTTKYSDDVETGKVIETNPAAGSSISKSTIVELIISRGKEKKPVTVPHLIGSLREDAEKTLKDAKFKYEVVEQEALGQGGRVINQTLAAGTTVEEGAEITITVGVEPEVQTVIIPSVIGRTQEEAQQILTNAGLYVSVVSEPSDDQVGKVIKQSPNENEEVNKGSTITITVGEEK